MDEDRIEGTGRAAGDAAGKAGAAGADDEPLEAKGLVGQTLGTVQDGYDRARTTVRALLDGAPEIARDAVATGRDYYRRGSAAVTRNGADGTALTLLAAGVAIAAVSWLVFGRRRGRDEA